MKTMFKIKKIFDGELIESLRRITIKDTKGNEFNCIVHVIDDNTMQAQIIVNGDLQFFDIYVDEIIKEDMENKTIEVNFSIKC